MNRHAPTGRRKAAAEAAMTRTSNRNTVAEQGATVAPETASSKKKRTPR